MSKHSDGHQTTVADAIHAILARLVPDGMDIDDLVDAVATEVTVWVAESYNEGLAAARQRVYDVIQ